MTCPLCSQPVSIPLIEVWCKNCGTYVRAHDGCTPGVNSDGGHSRILDTHRNGNDCGLTKLRRTRPWHPDLDALSEQPLDRPAYLKESTHIPGSTLSRRGRKEGQ